MPSIGNLYADVVPNFKTLGSNIAAQSPLLKKMGSGIGGKLMLGIGAGIAVAGTIVAKQAIDAALEFEKGLATIRTGTGATGKQLEELGEGARRVFRQVPQDFQEVSGTLADLNTRTGATGGRLEGLTRTMLDLSRITKEDVNRLIPATTRLFGDWSVKTKDQVGALDDLFKLSQSTGVGVSTLSELMVKFGSPLRQLGFDMDEAATMFAKFEQEGVNIQTLMPGFKQAVSNLARPTSTLKEEFDKAGISLKDGFKPALEGVFETLLNTEDPMEAAALAANVFGTRAGPDMAAAIQEGRFELEDLMGTVDASGESIEKAGKESLTLGEKWEILKNKINDILVPLGEKLIPKVEELVEWFGKAIEPSGSLGKLFGFIGDNARTLATIAGGVLAAAIGVKLVNAFNAMKLAFATNPFGLVIVAAITAATLIIQNWDKIKEFLGGVWDWIKRTSSNIWNALKDATGAVIDFMRRMFANYVEFWFGVADKILAGAEFAFGWVPGIGDKIKQFREDFQENGDKIVASIRGTGDKTNQVMDSMARHTDFTRSSVSFLNREFGKIPKSKETKFKTPGLSAANSQVAEMLRNLGRMPDEVNIRANIGGFGGGPVGPMGAGAGTNYGRMFGAARMFGLGVSSTYRPGDDGHHGQPGPHGAVDISGPAPQMLAAARYLVSNFGRSMREVIHTPLGFGIKNGVAVPLSFWGSLVNAMHYNHVHGARRGFNGMVNSPTMFLAGEGNQREHVRVTPANRLASHRGEGNTFVFNINADSTTDGQKLARFIRREFVGYVRRAEALSG